MNAKPRRGGVIRLRENTVWSSDERYVGFSFFRGGGSSLDADSLSEVRPSAQPWSIRSQILRLNWYVHVLTTSCVSHSKLHSKCLQIKAALLTDRRCCFGWTLPWHQLNWGHVVDKSGYILASLGLNSSSKKGQHWYFTWTNVRQMWVRWHGYVGNLVPTVRVNPVLMTFIYAELFTGSPKAPVCRVSSLRGS